jgi:hypothetical protein
VSTSSSFSDGGEDQGCGERLQMGALEASVITRSEPQSNAHSALCVLRCEKCGVGNGEEGRCWMLEQVRRFGVI